MSVKIYHDGSGYAFFCSRMDKKYHLYEHRVLMFAWGELDSVFFSEDSREVHHKENPKWLNIRENLVALTPQEHREIDPQRAKIVTPWDGIA